MGISKITAINTGYSDLDKVYPSGLELILGDSDLVFIVGPNGSGKTALYRLISTSLEFERYYGEKGISKFWRTWDLITDTKFNDGLDANKMKDFFGGDKVNLVDVYTGSVDPNWILCPFRRRLLERIDLLYGTGLLGGFKGYNGQSWVTKGAYRTLLKLPDKLRKNTDLNRWGFLKLDLAYPVYYQELCPYAGHTVTEQLRLEEKVRQGFFDDENIGLLRKKGVGRDLWDDIVKGFKNIDDFFTKGKNPVFRPYISPEEAFSYFRYKDFWSAEIIEENKEFCDARLNLRQDPEIKENVPKDANLVVFIDTPEAHIDYIKQIQFEKKLRSALEKYRERLQVFLITHDRTLIETPFPNARYISLYSGQAKVVKNYRQILK